MEINSGRTFTATNADIVKDLVTTLDCVRQRSLAKKYDSNFDTAVQLNVQEILNTSTDIRRKYGPTGAIPKRFKIIGMGNFYRFNIITYQ